MKRPLLTLLLPGLDGSGRLFARFLAATTGGLEMRALAYPPGEPLGYAELERRVLNELPTDRPFALLGESFSGPVALRLAQRAPPGLVALVLAASFHRRPVGRGLALLGRTAAAVFALELPAPAVRLLLAGIDAPSSLVAEVREATAAVPGRVLAARARAALEVDASEALAACPVPLLFLSGAHDRLLRRELGDEVRALNPRALVKALPAPHLVLQRRPGEAMAVLEEFLGGAGKRASPRRRVSRRTPS